ncbi:MAG TPA: hypothetical protein VGP06_16265 [Janthinobacterium sp.]|nr:hypothetical protein [Janthinobacterium sp.]
MKQIEQTHADALLQTCRIRLAKEQSALHATRLALARWTSAADYAELQMMRIAPPSIQSRWCAQTQQGFTAWLAGGGFAQAGSQAEKETAPEQLGLEEMQVPPGHDCSCLA